MGLILVVEYTPISSRIKKERIAFYCESGDETKALEVARSYGVLFCGMNSIPSEEGQTIVRDNLSPSSITLHEYGSIGFDEYWGKDKIELWYWKKRYFDVYKAKYRRSTTRTMMRII